MTKQYYYTDGQNQFGPFNIDELKTKEITKETLIWYEGIDSWTKAGEITELAAFFKSIPPPLHTIAKTPPPVTTQIHVPEVNRKKKKKLWIILGVIIGLFVLGGITTIVYLKINDYSVNYDNQDSSSDDESSSDYNESNSNYNTEPPREKTPEELKQELYEKEKQNPLNYLSVSYSTDYKLLSGKNILKGNIYNTATIATFKDVVVTVTYFTETGTVLSTQDFIVYQYVYPSNSTTFNATLTTPAGAKQVDVEVKSAIGE